MDKIHLLINVILLSNLSTFKPLTLRTALSALSGNPPLFLFSECTPAHQPSKHSAFIAFRHTTFHHNNIHRYCDCQFIKYGWNFAETTSYHVSQCSRDVADQHQHPSSRILFYHLRFSLLHQNREEVCSLG